MKKLVFFLFVFASSVSAWSQTEIIKIAWPEDWKVGSEQKTRTLGMTEYVPKKESVNSWTILGTTMIYKGKAGVPIESMMNIIFNGAKKNAINPTLKVIDKKVDGDNPWIIFKIESEGFTNDKTPESQLFYVIEGENDLYSNFVAVKKSSLTSDFVDHWTTVFKASQFKKE